MGRNECVKPIWVVVAGVVMAAVGMPAGHGANSRAANMPVVLQAEDLGYTAKVVWVGNSDEKKPGEMSFMVRLSGKDEAAWSGSTGERAMFFPDEEVWAMALTEDGKFHMVRSEKGIQIWPPTLIFRHADLGGAEHHLTALEFDMSMVKVTQWEQVTVKRDGPDEVGKKREPIVCGPYHFNVGGDDMTFHVTAWTTGGEAYKEYTARAPLAFQGHTFAVSMATIKDSEGRDIPTGTIFTTGGASVRSFPGGEVAMTRRADGSMEMKPLPAKKIAYPVTVTLRMPAKWERQQVAYRLGEQEMK